MISFGSLMIADTGWEDFNASTCLSVRNALALMMLHLEGRLPHIKFNKLFNCPIWLYLPYTLGFDHFKGADQGDE